MKTIPAFFMVLITGASISCRSPRTVAPIADNISLPDSLTVTVTSTNLSENMTGNDEVLIFCYSYRDSSELDEPFFHQKLRINLKNASRKFKWKMNKSVANKPWMLFLIEQDTERPVHQIDSTLQVNHRSIRQEFNNRNYSGIEKYLGDDDILGFKVIGKMDYTRPTILNFVRRYKLDKYEYQVRIESANNDSYAP